MQNKLSRYLCGYRKDYSIFSYASPSIFWQSTLGNDKIGALLMDLSKDFDCLPHYPVKVIKAKIQDKGNPCQMI